MASSVPSCSTVRMWPWVSVQTLASSGLFPVSNHTLSYLSIQKCLINIHFYNVSLTLHNSQPRPCPISNVSIEMLLKVSCFSPFLCAICPKVLFDDVFDFLGFELCSFSKRIHLQFEYVFLCQTSINKLTQIKSQTLCLCIQILVCFVFSSGLLIHVHTVFCVHPAAKTYASLHGLAHLLRELAILCLENGEWRIDVVFHVGWGCANCLNVCVCALCLLIAYSKTAPFTHSISFSGDGKSNLDKSNLNKNPGKQVAINIEGKGGGDSDSGECIYLIQAFPDK